MWIEKNHKGTNTASFPTYETPHRVKSTDVESTVGVTRDWIVGEDKSK